MGAHESIRGSAERFRDAFGGGTQDLTDTMRKLGERLQLLLEESAEGKPEGFLDKSLRVRMEWRKSCPLTGNFVNMLDGNDYLNSVETMKITDDSRFLSWSEITDFRCVVGFCRG